VGVDSVTPPPPQKHHSFKDHPFKDHSFQDHSFKELWTPPFSPYKVVIHSAPHCCTPSSHKLLSHQPLILFWRGGRYK
jgi:hypothetical protein